MPVSCEPLSFVFQADFFAFELLNGHIYLHLDLGSGGVKVTSTTRRVDDGLWHEVTLRRAGKEGRVTADGTASDFSSPGNIVSDSNQLDLEGPLYIGGVGPPTATLAVPPVLWAGVLRYGYVGCMRDLVINGNAIDIAGYARQQDYGSNLFMVEWQRGLAVCLQDPGSILFMVEWQRGLAVCLVNPGSILSMVE
uniref:Laminin G domain-containing protein n=1 Tax=Timema shepardi TaxID=629360 RepID=A0A7R9AX05_TIMSH|nr:unnamed protein product [Timema shepardi]